MEIIVLGVAMLLRLPLSVPHERYELVPECPGIDCVLSLAAHRYDLLY